MDFDKLYELYFKDIYHYMLGVSKDPHLSEEITQETFYKALRSLYSFDGRKDIRAWLFTIAKNTYLSYRKKDSRIDYEYSPQDISDEVNFVEQIVDEERSFQIHKYINKQSAIF